MKHEMILQAFDVLFVVDVVVVAVCGEWTSELTFVNVALRGRRDYNVEGANCTKLRSRFSILYVTSTISHRRPETCLPFTTTSTAFPIAQRQPQLTNSVRALTLR